MQKSDLISISSMNHERILDIFWSAIELLDGSLIYFNQYNGVVSNKFKKNCLIKCKGGILGDEMGLGKTVMALSLILTDKSKENIAKKKKQIEVQKSSSSELMDEALEPEPDMQKKVKLNPELNQRVLHKKEKSH